MDPKQQALLEQIGRKGWSVISTKPNTEFTAGSYPGERVPKYPEGSETWVISDGKGQNQTLVVKTPAPYPGPYAATTNDPGAYNPDYTVVEPPQNMPASAGTANQGFTDILAIKNADGTTTRWGKDPKDGQFKALPGVPTEAAPSTPRTASPSKPEDWQVLKTPEGKPISMYDPATGTHVPIPQDSATRIADGTQKQTLDQGRTVTWEARNGEWNIKSVGQPLQDPNKPVEGATRPATNSKGEAIQEVYRGGSWTTDTSVAPKPFGTQPTTVVSAPANEQNLVTQQGGAFSTQANPNYVPTDPVLRGQQLQSQAKAKREDLQQQVLNGQITQEDALGQWNDYWNTQVEPIRQEIQQAQQQTQLENQLKVNQDARATDTLADTAANDLMGHAQTGATTGAGLLNTRMQQASGMMNNVLGIGTGSKNFGIGAGGAPDVSGLPDAVGSYLTNMGGGQGVYDTAANLVRNIDPNNSSGFAAHAAAALSQVMDRAQQQAAGTYQYGGGMPQPKPVDSILNQSAYGGAFGQAPTGPAAPTTTVAPDGTITVQHVAPQSDPSYAASVADPTSIRGFQ